MKEERKARLLNTIEQWVETECRKSDWEDVIWGRKTTRLMTDAAIAVFDAVVESQEYAIRQGYLR